MSENLRRRSKATALLAAMLFLLVAASFHSAADNDLSRAGVDESRPGLSSASSGSDTCPACSLDGVLLARLTLALPIAIPVAAEGVTLSIPASPFVSPRASVESRPPPSIA